MGIYKPSELRQFLTGLGIHPKKVLSQNFLVDGNILRKIVRTAQVVQDDLVLEIGPGPGSLTEALLEAGAHVIAVEKDDVLAEALKRFDNPSLEIFNDDILAFPIESILKERLKPGQKAKVIANLPYHLTTPILIKLVQMTETISHLIVMVQDEVGRRLAAAPGNKHYSSLTIFLNFFATPRYEFTVSRTCFYPAPRVESAIISLELKVPPAVADQAKFFEITRTAFEHRRKMLKASLRHLYPSEVVMAALAKIGENPEARPEMLSVEQFLALYKLLDAKYDEIIDS